MANFGGMYNANQGIMNQLLRQKDNVENLIQHIINQTANLEMEAKILNNGEDYTNIGITRRTLFVDETNKKVVIKELDGSISKEYEIIVPLDEKDKKILELENRLKEMEVKINEHTEPSRTNDEQQQSNADVDGDAKS